MTNDFIDAYFLFGFIFLTFFIILLSCINRYRSLRWSRILNAAYQARLASQETTFETFEYQPHQSPAECCWEVEAVHVGGGFRSRGEYPVIGRAEL